MIVRDDGAHWQVVLQTDHAATAAELARAWTGVIDEAAPERRSSVLRAVARHDDGWAVSEAEPARDRDGAPRNFFDVPHPVQIAQYRAAIAAISDVDPYAGLLISMHGAGLWGGDYGWTMPPPPEAHRDAALAFVAEQEQGYESRAGAIGVGDAERWAAFDLLQLADRLSLYFCMQPEIPEARVFERAPRPGSPPLRYEVEPIGARHVAMDPFPFAGETFCATLRTRAIPKREWSSESSFRSEFWATSLESTQLTISNRVRQ